ncbi:uncharacterized protein LOC106711350 [Papilio machaon]|uniref:uncharacterized protein LOC106711350 n=1 Tax=Papilio machaon TaxID=76193 RepID=UPI001E665371|nr:uncharacterized protein LOC106711350 [Papilio machaon]
MIRISLLLMVAGCFLPEGYASIAPFACIPGDSACFIKANTRVALSYLGDGIPELGVDSLEPMYLRNITMDQGHFKLVFPNMKLAGAKNCKIEDIQLSFAQSTISVTYDCPFEATGKYKFSGKMFFFDVNHSGDYVVKSDRFKTTIISKIDTIYGPDGNRYWNLVASNYFFEPVEPLHIDLGRLFVGEITKESPFYTVTSNRWWPAVAKISEPTLTAAVERFHNVLKSFFLRMPLEELSK